MKRQYPPTHPVEIERYAKEHEEKEKAVGKKLKDEWLEEDEPEIDGSEGPNADEIALTPEEQQGLEDAESGIDKTFAPSRLRRYAAGELPGEEADVSPEKARQILKDGEVNGHPLTEAQRKMFGAIAAKGEEKERYDMEPPPPPTAPRKKVGPQTFVGGGGGEPPPGPIDAFLQTPLPGSTEPKPSEENSLGTDASGNILMG